MYKGKKRGRKSKYETHVKPYIDRIPAWRKQGLKEDQIALKLGISEASLYVYKKEFIEFSEALKEGKEQLIEKLEESLYTRAMGKEYEEVKTYIEKVGKKEKKRIEKTKKIIHSDTCLVFALKNLDPTRFKDKHEHVIEQDVDININFVANEEDEEDEEEIKEEIKEDDINE